MPSLQVKILTVVIAAILTSSTAIEQSRYELERGTPVELISKSKEIMLNEVGKKETGKNRGIADKYNKVLGLPLGSPYCQSGQYWTYWKAAKELGYSTSDIPMPRSGMANATYDYIRRRGLKTAYKAKVNDFIIWKSPTSYSGHIERIISVGRAGWVKTVGFNTSSGRRGSQWNGGGVWIRNRNIRHPLLIRKIRGLAGPSEVARWIKDCVRHADLIIAK